jgi:hypothetical protein
MIQAPEGCLISEAPNCGVTHWQLPSCQLRSWRTFIVQASLAMFVMWRSVNMFIAQATGDERSFIVQARIPFSLTSWWEAIENCPICLQSNKTFSWTQLTLGTISWCVLWLKNALPRPNMASRGCAVGRTIDSCSKVHRDKTRVQMPAKIFPHLKVKC